MSTDTDRNLEKNLTKKSLLQNNNSRSQFLHWLEVKTYLKQQFSCWETVWHSSMTFLVWLDKTIRFVLFCFPLWSPKILLWWSCLTLRPKSMEASKGWNV